MKKRKKQVVKEQVWLSQKLRKDQWTHGLARLKNGMIVVSEVYARTRGFVPCGHDGYYNDAQRLLPGTKRLIIRSLYKACYEWLKENGDVPVYDGRGKWY